MHAKARNKRQLTWSTGDAFFFSPSLSVFVWHSPVLLASFSFLLPIFFSSLSLLLCFAFLFLKAGAETDKDDRCWSFCAQPTVAASGDSESDGHAGFGLCSFSLFLLMLSLEMTMKACCAGGVVVLASVFSLLSTVSFLWLSLPCLSLVSSCLSFLVFLCSLLSFSAFFFLFSLFTVTNRNSCSLCFIYTSLAVFSALFSPFFSSFYALFFFCPP